MSIVHVVTHIHRGVLWNVAVFQNDDDAIEFHEELAEKESSEDAIDKQTCEII